MDQSNVYGQFCPVAQAAAVLAERWTPLVVRELLCGSVRFNDLQRGVPRMSSSLLSRRLKELEYVGVLERRRAGKTGYEYHLTPAGRELFPVVETMGLWAQRWMRDDNVAAEKLDVSLLMWDVRRRVIAGKLQQAEERYVVEFQFTGPVRGHRRYWLVFDRGEVDLCYKDPGYEIALYVVSPLRTLTQVWLGHLTLAEAQRTGGLSFEGGTRDIAAFRSWFALSLFAPAGRLPTGQMELEAAE
ncbi:MAG TPA: helix-turn-helix domain-containing protein [Pseudolabrys sp.]|jgi:DNA-binding HxlR family transcriptional regulator|nr:helix-turn-helix domain-containing protein [Pseudolabrys sp.]